VAQALALVVLLSADRTSAGGPVVAPSPCPKKGDVVRVIARKRELWLCQGGAALAKFRVAMGRGGFDKRRKGDGRTPLGTYTLGTPRPSPRYGVFIPIDYPTPDQAANGFTGSDVGIHGPPRGLTEPKYPTTAVDWTEGCIATGMDADIGVIAEFVRARQPMLVIR
jgi:murein L,D-transpeptidase YafK